MRRPNCLVVFLHLWHTPRNYSMWKSIWWGRPQFQSADPWDYSLRLAWRGAGYQERWNIDPRLFLCAGCSRSLFAFGSRTARCIFSWTSVQLRHGNADDGSRRRHYDSWASGTIDSDALHPQRSDP